MRSFPRRSRVDCSSIRSSPAARCHVESSPGAPRTAGERATTVRRVREPRRAGSRSRPRRCRAASRSARSRRGSGTTSSMESVVWPPTRPRIVGGPTTADSWARPRRLRARARRERVRSRALRRQWLSPPRRSSTSSRWAPITSAGSRPHVHCSAGARMTWDNSETAPTRTRARP